MQAAFDQMAAAHNKKMEYLAQKQSAGMEQIALTFGRQQNNGLEHMAKMFGNMMQQQHKATRNMLASIANGVQPPAPAPGIPAQPLAGHPMPNPTPASPALEGTTEADEVELFQPDFTGST